jgi:hypothetical protein
MKTSSSKIVCHSKSNNFVQYKILSSATNTLISVYLFCHLLEYIVKIQSVNICFQPIRRQIHPTHGSPHRGIPEPTDLHPMVQILPSSPTHRTKPDPNPSWATETRSRTPTTTETSVPIGNPRWLTHLPVPGATDLLWACPRWRRRRRSGSGSRWLRRWRWPPRPRPHCLLAHADVPRRVVVAAVRRRTIPHGAARLSPRDPGTRSELLDLSRFVLSWVDPVG